MKPPAFVTDIRELHARYAGGVTPVAMVDQAFAAVDAANDPGIFISTAKRDDVRAAARALPPFDPVAMPLWGVPFAVKDNIDVAGIPTTAAAPAFAYTPSTSAHAVERLVAAGALMIGKTNLDQFAAGLVGVRTPFPIPRNAIDPGLVPGGSSSGSAVAVARGLVSFALGTDTAGSGRVPAGLNNIVGLKPSVGAVSIRGVVPACRTLDCVSVFALTVDDAWRVFKTMVGYDAADPFSRRIDCGALSPCPPHFAIGVPRESDLRFFGDGDAKAAWSKAVAIFERMGARIVDVDMTPFYDAAALLYDGPWIAERYAAIQSFIEGNAHDVHPVTLSIIEKAKERTATDTFKGIYRLAELKRAIEPVLSSIDALVVPTMPRAPTLKQLLADPIKPNSELGTYTNFVNLLGMCGIAVPGPFRRDGSAAGVTLLGASGRDGALASLARVFQAEARVSLGATGRRAQKPETIAPVPPQGYQPLVVVGAHMSDMPLNKDVRALGGVFLSETKTAPLYALYALPGGPPMRPGLVRVGDGGAEIAVEVWALPVAGFGAFVASIPSPLGIGTIKLADGSEAKGFLCEAYAIEGARNITEYGGWRAFAAAKA